MRREEKIKLILTLLLCTMWHGVSQQIEFKGDPDVAFAKARDLAFNKNRKQAQDTLRLILTKYPNYLDVRSFLASTYSWDGAYEHARKEFVFIFSKDPKRKRDWIAAVNNELWGEQPLLAIRLIEKALIYFIQDPDILLLKAKAQEAMGEREKALETTRNILSKSPLITKVKDYQEGLINRLSLNTVGINYAMDLFGEGARDPMQYFGLRYSRQTRLGSVTAKVNIHRRFQVNGIQYEVDMYPRIVNGLYAYASVGFSNTDLFPSFRMGGELYKSLPKAFEVSLGFRSMKFTETTTIYTGSIGWYTGNSYWVFRAYVTPGDVGTSKSGRLTYRKYRSDAENYFSASIGLGFSPEIDRFPVTENAQAIFDLKSQKIALGYYFTSSNKQHAWGTSLSFSHEEKSYSRGDYFLIYSVGLSFNLKFK